MTVLINIDVPSLEQAKLFYQSAFGLTAGRRLGDRALEMIGWPSPVYLLERASGSIGAALDPRRYERHWTPIHLDVVVSDMDRAVTRALAAGATIERAAAEAPYGRIAMLADPFGHGFCLIEFNDEGYDSLGPAERRTRGRSPES